MPKISIIIPMYNVEKYLRRCLDSVQCQTFTDWQAICVDDGSPDNSGKIAEEYAARDKRFVVLHKKNGGLSDARNSGMQKASGKYIMFLDSDDFMHPQTMEIAYTIIQNNKSDIVSFRYNRLYRLSLMIRHILHLDNDNVIPFGFKKKYNVSTVDNYKTKDIFEIATERSHNKDNSHRKWLIKHCQVWKSLYRKNLISDIPFIKGIVFEDFPWWSAVMLKQPQTTSITLPLYYYVPNFDGIVLSAKQLNRIQSLCIGIKDAYNLYCMSASEYQMKKWTEEFLWFFINKAFSKIKYLKTENELNIARKEFLELQKLGVFDVVPNRWNKLACYINIFVKTGEFYA